MDLKTKINIIDVKFEHKKVFTNISKKSNVYIKNCFDKSLKIMKEFGNECNKKMTIHLGDAEKRKLFYETANKVYKLES